MLKLTVNAKHSWFNANHCSIEIKKQRLNILDIEACKDAKSFTVIAMSLRQFSQTDSVLIFIVLTEERFKRLVSFFKNVLRNVTLYKEVQAETTFISVYVTY